MPADLKTADYRHKGEKRTNIPPARIAGEGTVPVVPKARYSYSPHLSPTLQFDPTGEPDKLDALTEAATKRPLTATEAERLRRALRVSEPTLEWAGKREQREKGFLEVDPVALHIHERVSARAIVRAALREDVQRELFADPQQPYQEAVQFYRHDVDWANRLILGDSLQVMSSLARRENLAGKVQMIYMDPPYGIKFASNFQNEIGNRDVKDKDQDLTREPEMVRAYRDTWATGTHSYLTYLRDRLLICRELLRDSGSIFVQISEENQHRVRQILDEVFGPENACVTIIFAKSSGLGSTLIPRQNDYLLWYAKDVSQLKYRQLFRTKGFDASGAEAYGSLLLSDGSTRRLTDEERSDPSLIPEGAKAYTSGDLTKPGPGRRYDVSFQGRTFTAGKRWWGMPPESMERLLQSGRVFAAGDVIRYMRFLEDFPAYPVTNLWSDTAAGSGADKVYVVQTSTKVIERCLLMTTEPGDLVIDPTCGSGTTAVVAEQWGRRWITIDTSRVAIATARQRCLCMRFDNFRLKDPAQGPASGFVYRAVPYVTLKSIANNHDLDSIFAAFDGRLASTLDKCNAALKDVTPAVRKLLAAKLREQIQLSGVRSISEADRRRWDLPSKFQHWSVPFDTDEAWPERLREAVSAYRNTAQERQEAIDACIAQNADQQELIDQPQIVKGVVRVSGPFTVEGVRPEELSLGEEGLFDATPNDFPEEERALAAAAQQQNLHAYLERMVRLIRQDGLTFLNNQRRRFAQVEPLFTQGIGDVLHAEGMWEGEDGHGSHDIAIGFGPQYGPVTALQVEELIRGSKRYAELVIAGFSFDADATSLIQQYSNKKLRIHQAYIRPDVNPGMDGLLKDTPNSQLFTVFGTPEIDVRRDKEGDWVVQLKGVDIYDPVANTVRSTGADKVAAWFLDSDFDGRCFATTQAFFPDQDAWEKIAKALGSSADVDAFEAFKGTVSVPFAAGKHKKVAVKVIDPRGNEVMAVRSIET